MKMKFTDVKSLRESYVKKGVELGIATQEEAKNPNNIGVITYEVVGRMKAIEALYSSYDNIRVITQMPLKARYDLHVTFNDGSYLKVEVKYRHQPGTLKDYELDVKKYTEMVTWTDPTVYITVLEDGNAYMWNVAPKCDPITQRTKAHFVTTAIDTTASTITQEIFFITNHAKKMKYDWQNYPEELAANEEAIRLNKEAEEKTKELKAQLINEIKNKNNETV